MFRSSNAKIAECRPHRVRHIGWCGVGVVPLRHAGVGVAKLRRDHRKGHGARGQAACIGVAQHMEADSWRDAGGGARLAPWRGTGRMPPARPVAARPAPCGWPAWRWRHARTGAHHLPCRAPCGRRTPALRRSARHAGPCRTCCAGCSRSRPGGRGRRPAWRTTRHSGSRSAAHPSPARGSRAGRRWPAARTRHRTGSGPWARRRRGTA